MDGDGLGERAEDAVEPPLGRGEARDELRVGQGERGPAGEELREGELVLVVVAARGADADAERAQGLVADVERERHRRAQAGALDVRRVLRVVAHRRAQLRVQHRELGALPAQRARRRRVLGALDGAALHQPRLHPLAVGMVDPRRDAAQAAADVEHVDPRRVGERGDEEVGEPLQGTVHVGGAVRDARRRGEQLDLVGLVRQGPDRTRDALVSGTVTVTTLPGGFELPLEPRLPRIGAIDQVALEERAAQLAKRSIKKESKAYALDLAVRMMDLTTLEGADTPGKVRRARREGRPPGPADPSIPSCAAICVYPNLVPVAVERVRGTGVKVASVATAFPSGQSPLAVKLHDVEEAVDFGADEIDMVIDRGAFLSGRYAQVYDEIVQVKAACGHAHLKVILETGELGTYDNVRRASLLAMAAGADFIKTSTGKLPKAATLPMLLCMLEAIRDVHDETGRVVGMKPAGGIKTAKQAVQNLVIVAETLGPDWLTPDRFRLGASSLLNDVLMQIRTLQDRPLPEPGALHP